MQGIYNYVPETNQLQFLAQAMLLSLLDVLYFYISTPKAGAQYHTGLFSVVINIIIFCCYNYHHHNHDHYCKLEVRYSYSLRYGRSRDRIPLRG